MNPTLDKLLKSIGRESLDYCNQDRLAMIRQIAQQADLLDWDIPIISVTGTNGKGSSVAALRHIYQAHGYQAGVFISPHLIDFNERIAINDRFISDLEFCHALQVIIDLDKKRQLSFFEVLTLSALYHFKQYPLDLLILEVGLGGRLDAINILDADVVLVTAIDLDHQALLGDTIDAIAREKAGLFRKQGQAVYSGESCPEALKACAHHLDVRLSMFKNDYDIQLTQTDWWYHSERYHLNFSDIPKVHIHAMAGAIRVAELLETRLSFVPKHIAQAVSSVFIPGRFQWIDDKVMVVLDVAHNPHAVDLLYNRLAQMPINGRLHTVFSALKDKDVKRIVEIFNNLKPLWYTCSLDTERAHSQESLTQIFDELGIEQQFYSTPAQAYEIARKHVKTGDIIVVFGSFYLIREVMLLLQQEGKHVF